MDLLPAVRAPSSFAAATTPPSCVSAIPSRNHPSHRATPPKSLSSNRAPGSWGTRSSSGKSSSMKAPFSATSVVSTSLQLSRGGVLNHPFTTESDVFTLTVDVAQVSIDATSRIDVSDRGYLGGRRAGNQNLEHGRTLGQVAGSPGRVGAGHGGLGGPGQHGRDLQPDLRGPIEPGSSRFGRRQ
jgi:hypothetical protein